MKKLCVVAWVLLLFMPVVEVWANRPEDFLIRAYNIHVTVDNLDYALARLLTMPGIDLHSEIDIQAGWGRMERLVDNHSLTAALDFLRGLGQVSRTESFAWSEFAQFSRLQSEFMVRNMEYARLMELLYEADTLSDFRFIESRLVDVIAQTERIRGDINRLNADMGTTRINITLSITPPEPEPEIEPEPEEEPEPEQEGSFRRIGRVFMESADASLVVIQNVVIFFSYISIPFVVILIIGGCVLWRLLRGKRKGDENGKAEEGEKTDDTTDEE